MFILVHSALCTLRFTSPGSKINPKLIDNLKSVSMGIFNKFCTYVQKRGPGTCFSLCWVLLGRGEE